MDALIGFAAALSCRSQMTRLLGVASNGEDRTSGSPPIREKAGFPWNQMELIYTMRRQLMQHWSEITQISRHCALAFTSGGLSDYSPADLPVSNWFRYLA